MIWIRMAVVWSVMRRYGAGCVLACVVLAGGVVVMVSVPFRGGWLVLPGKGTPVHNHPDTKGFAPDDTQTLQRCKQRPSAGAKHLIFVLSDGLI